MKNQPAAIFFDKNDYQLLNVVNDVLERINQPDSLRSVISESMHPHGIKEMAAAKGLRIAYASACLLGSLETGKSSDRITALRSLRDEVFLSSSSFYQKNTARVLLQIMKELLRCRDNELRQLKLAHDFRMASTGRPLLIRAELAKYHLLEMPEEWNQVSFDDHVHDANTKGRKSPTHLVMDAWIKGIRSLTVVYYNFVNPKVVQELLDASEILDVRVQIGIEMSASYRDKYVRFTWEPHGFTNNHALLQFLQEGAVQSLMDEGREVSRYQQQFVFKVLDAFNNRHRLVLQDEFAVDFPAIGQEDFIRFVGTGQPSLLHLAKLIHQSLEEHIIAAYERQLWEIPADSKDSQDQLIQLRRRFASCGIDSLMRRFLQPGANPELQDISVPHGNSDQPALLRLSPAELLGRLTTLHTSSRFTLNPSNISIQDILELLYNCGGKISHIEAYNLKNASHGMTSLAASSGCTFAGEAVDLVNPERSYQLISQLQQALNEDNVILLKRAIRAIIWDYEGQRLRLFTHLQEASARKEETGALADELAAMDLRKEHLLDILLHMQVLHGYYQKRILGSRIGSGSTGQTEHQYGMGLVVLETLPARAQKKVLAEVSDGRRKLIPVTAGMTSHRHSRRLVLPETNWFARLISMLPLGHNLQRKEWHDWTLEGLTVHPGRPGNIVTLGGLRQTNDLDSTLVVGAQSEKIDQPLRYLNTNLKNSLKVLVGFIPAFLTFSLTKDWWVLAYLGAFIWFGITGARNVIQSVLGGGGLRRSPLLPWNSLVSWSRIADSLLYTGFSVPLLDFLVKTLLLDRTFGVTTTTNPILLYSVMGLANGIYISSHNTFRGLPRSAAIGNFFRSILSIPLAVLLNSLIGSALTMAAVPGVDAALQKWAAVISKVASDCVAAVIEGMADRQANIRVRLQDYQAKISQLFAVFARLDLLFPEEDVLDILQSPKQMMDTISYEARDLEKTIIVNALDLMYFWLYQPRARRALEKITADMSREEWLIFYRSQLVLKRYREISQVFIDGLVGKHFAKALSFYLDNWEDYLREIARLEEKHKPA